MGFRLLFVVTLVVALPGGFAGAADLPAQTAIDRGEQLATRLCSRCHAVGRTGASPLKQATPFRLFATKWPLEYLEEALAEGIVTGHKAMPEFTFTPDQILSLLSYIDRLAPD